MNARSLSFSFSAALVSRGSARLFGNPIFLSSSLKVGARAPGRRDASADVFGILRVTRP